MADFTGVVAPEGYVLASVLEVDSAAPCAAEKLRGYVGDEVANTDVVTYGVAHVEGALVLRAYIFSPKK